MIVLDMEMPKSCRACDIQDCCVEYQDALGRDVDGLTTKRLNTCPIKGEIRTGKFVKSKN